MKRALLLAPLAALALLTARPTLAQEADPWAELVELGQFMRTNDYGRPILNVGFAGLQCMTPDPEDVRIALEQSDALARRAAELAVVLPGRQHVEALQIAQIARRDYWGVMNAKPSERCYVPPAE